MTSRPFRWLALGAGLCALPLGAAEEPPPTVVNTPAKNWVFPRFTKEGYRWMTLRGTEVREVSAAQIDIVDMNITVYSQDAAAQIDSIILSPAASYFLRENRATGPQTVRLIDYREQLEVTGEQWTYEPDRKKISLARNVRVIIHAPLPDLLK
jgi:hypothetical protein